MSRIRTNIITNRMANGAPTVSNGLVISGVTTTSDIKVGTNITLTTTGGGNFSGIVTATTFSGSGASLTNLNASNIASGTVPTARLGSGTANSSTFLAGDSTFKTITGTTINNNADNRLITGSGTANTLEGESNLTFDGTSLDVNTSATAASSEANTLVLGHGSGNYVGMTLQCAPSYPGSIFFTDTDSGNQGQIVYYHAGNQLALFANSQQKLTCSSTGVTINNGSLFVNDSIIHNNDTNTKIRFPDADTITAETGGSERLRITSAGRVGIGEDSPDGMLHIKGAVPAIYLEDTSGTHGQTIIEQNDDNLKIRCDAGNASSGNGSNIQFQVDASEKVRITPSGLGINVTAPATTLHLDSTGTPTTIQIDSDTESSIDFNDHGGSAKRYKIGTNITDNSGQFEIKDMTANAERLRITSGGTIRQTGGDLVIDNTNNGYGGLRIVDDSGGDYTVNYITGRNQGATAHVFKYGGRVQNQSPWANSGSDAEIARISRGGIAFGGDTAAANTLDDYEEGSWTPNYSRPNMTIGNAGQVGRYTKVGRVVHIVGKLYTTSESGSPTGGPITVTGLPFTVRETRCALSVRPSGWSNDHPSFATFELNQTFFELLEEVEGNPSGSTDLGGSRFAGGTGNYLWFSGSYFTDS